MTLRKIISAIKNIFAFLKGYNRQENLSTSERRSVQHPAEFELRW